MYSKTASRIREAVRLYYPLVGNGQRQISQTDNLSRKAFSTGTLCDRMKEREGMAMKAEKAISQDMRMILPAGIFHE